MPSAAVEINTETTSALLFDLDGTLVKNMEFHFLAWQELLAELGHTWDIARVKREIWGKNQDIFERIFPGQYSIDQAIELALKKELRYIELYRPHIKMIDGLEELLRSAQDAHLAMAIATAAPTVCVTFVCEALKLDRFFHHVVHADLVTNSKPHPETYLTAANLVSADPSHCIVFEDAPVGVRAAEAAQMESIVVLTTHEEHEFTQFERVRGFVPDFRSVRIL